MTTSASSAQFASVVASVTRHTDYYLDTIVFQVQNTIFRVPRFQFERHSCFFATNLSFPAADGVLEGSTESKPLNLEGINRWDFESFLKVLYPLTPVPKTPTLTNTEWLSVLKLANMWDFLEIRDLAIEKLADHASSESLNCVERIILGRQYEVSAWLRAGYTELARRDAPINAEEAEKIGIAATLQIFQLREAALKKEQDSFKSLELGDLFKAEFQRLHSSHEPPSAPPSLTFPGPDLKINFAAASRPAAAESQKSKRIIITLASPISTSVVPTGPFSFTPSLPSAAQAATSTSA